MTDSAATFLFADIAGFTALTEAHGDQEAAELAAEFAAAVKTKLPGEGAQVKTIGDAIMLRIPDPAEAIVLGLDIVHGLLPDHGAPAVRVGLHHGSAVERDGNYFGATVNLAARVSALAAGGEVLLTGQTAALAPDLQGVFYEARGRHELRNVREPVELFSAVPVGESARAGLAADPVCRMAVDPERAAGRLMYDGTAYFFCTLACAGEFARDPERFVPSGSTEPFQRGPNPAEPGADSDPSRRRSRAGAFQCSFRRVTAFGCSSPTPRVEDAPTAAPRRRCTGTPPAIPFSCTVLLSISRSATSSAAPGSDRTSSVTTISSAPESAWTLAAVLTVCPK